MHFVIYYTTVNIFRFELMAAYISTNLIMISPIVVETSDLREERIYLGKTVSRCVFNFFNFESRTFLLCSVNYVVFIIMSFSCFLILVA